MLKLKLIKLSAVNQIMRLDKLQKHLSKNELALLVSLDEEPNTNMVYFTGYKGLGIVAVLKDKAFLVVPRMEHEKALKTGLEVFTSEKKRRMLDILADEVPKVKKVRLEEDRCTVALFKKLKEKITGEYGDIGQTVARIRMLKEPEELNHIKKACETTDEIFTKIVDEFTFKTEKQLKEFILEEIKAYDCEPAFTPVVASGKGSSQPHYDEETIIEDGFLLLDFGAKYKGYCADMSRTVYLGTPDEKEKKYYQLVLETLQACEQAAVEKKTFAQLYEIALQKFGDDAEYFTHALGHGVGLDIHEPPSLNEDDETDLQDTIVFTVEPGLYFMGAYGIRIEDTVVLQNGKLKILTKSPKHLIAMDSPS